MAAVLDLTKSLQEQTSNQQFPTTHVERPVPYTVDPGHLLVLDQNTHSADAFSHGPEKLAEHLYQTCRDGVQALINRIWELPISASGDGATILADLPEPEFVVPREKPIPTVKPLTRWERFAKEKGIKNTKKSRFVYSETLKEWVPRHGYKSEKNQMLSKETGDWVIEVPDNADPYECQFEKRMQEKKERITKNKKRQQRNIDETGGGNNPLDALQKMKNRPKTEKEVNLMNSIKISRQSTASMGLFDKAISEEKQIVGRKNMSLNRKRKLITDIGDEKEVMQKVLKKVERQEGGVLTKAAIEKGANREMANEQRQKRKAGKPGKPMNKKGRK